MLNAIWRYKCKIDIKKGQIKGQILFNVLLFIKKLSFIQ